MSLDERFLRSLARAQQSMRRAKQDLAVRFARPTHQTLDFDFIVSHAQKYDVEIELTAGVRLADGTMIDAVVTATPLGEGWTVHGYVQRFDAGPEVIWSRESSSVTPTEDLGRAIEAATEDTTQQLRSIVRRPEFSVAEPST